MSPAEKPVVVIGAGGHGLVVIDALRTARRRVVGVIDPRVPPRLPTGVPYLGAELAAVRPEDVELALGVGSVDVGSKNRRPEIFAEGARAGFRWATVRHASAIVASDVQLGEGVQFMAGCIIQPGVRLGDNVIINTRASVDHECVIGEHVHIAPGATLSGGVTIGAGCHLGTGCIIIHGIAIGEGSMIGAGAVVTRSTPERSRVRTERPGC